MTPRSCLLLSLFAVGCGHHASINAEAVKAERRPDGTIEATVSVRSNAQNDWPADEEFCIHVEWKDSSKLSQAPAAHNAPYGGSPDAAVPAIDRAKLCVRRGIATRETVDFKLASTKPVPSSPSLTILAHLEFAPTGKTGSGPQTIVRDWVVKTPSP